MGNIKKGIEVFPINWFTIMDVIELSQKHGSALAYYKDEISDSVHKVLVIKPKVFGSKFKLYFNDHYIEEEYDNVGETYEAIVDCMDT